MMATSVGEPWYPPGDDRSGLALVLRMPHLARFRSSRVSEFTQRPTLEVRKTTLAVFASTASSTGTTKSVAVIWPEVRVPVLSLHKMPTQPNVSTASIFLTSTLRWAICLDAIMRQTVTVGSKPSGTWAKKAVAAFSSTSAKLLLCGEMMLAIRDKHPTAAATQAIRWTKCSIWTSKEDRVLDVLILAAICPRIVSSPVPNTMPKRRPWTTVVPLKTTFRASMSGTSAEAAEELLGSATDSPVKAALSTRVVSEQTRTRKSAGTFCPASN
mmetsp:Transcript_1736/g.3845  ORF Transcript_1736/g.3845 Transcript_1736/m.3845 type:complete len:270 (+) Transcript_1736:1676-2485(+)